MPCLPAGMEGMPRAIRSSLLIAASAVHQSAAQLHEPAPCPCCGVGMTAGGGQEHQAPQDLQSVIQYPICPKTVDGLQVESEVLDLAWEHRADGKDSTHAHRLLFLSPLLPPQRNKSSLSGMSSNHPAPQVSVSPASTSATRWAGTESPC